MNDKTQLIEDLEQHLSESQARLATLQVEALQLSAAGVHPAVVADVQETAKAELTHIERCVQVLEEVKSSE